MSYLDDINNIEKAICISDSHSKGIGKFFIPIVTPGLSHSYPYNTKILKPSTKNIVSGNANLLGIEDYQVSNYIELRSSSKLYRNDKVIIALLSGKNSFFNPKKDIHIIGRV